MGKKRASDESGAATRAPKAAKTSDSANPGNSASKGGKKGAQAALSHSAFKSHALPLHVNVTHTPPSIEDGGSAPSDPGLIGNTTLVPTTFSTGSYGWKGSKRVTIELDKSEDGKDKEKVQVMLSINATVVGSKNPKGGEEQEDTEDKPEETAEENDEE